MLLSDDAITRISINSSLPQFDHLEAGGFREYDFRWRPASDDHGTGAFRIELPYGIPELLLQPMTIVGSETG